MRKTPKIRKKYGSFNWINDFKLLYRNSDSLQREISNCSAIRKYAVEFVRITIWQGPASCVTTEFSDAFAKFHGKTMNIAALLVDASMRVPGIHLIYYSLIMGLVDTYLFCSQGLAALIKPANRQPIMVIRTNTTAIWHQATISTEPSSSAKIWDWYIFDWWIR